MAVSPTMPFAPKRPSKYLLVVLCAAILHGCATGPARLPGAQAEVPADELQLRLARAQADARVLLNDDRPLDAAKHLWKVSNTTPSPHREDLRLQAVAMLFDNQRAIEAHAFLSRFEETNLKGARLLTKRLFDARFMEQTKRPAKIPPLLPLALVETGPPGLQLRAHRMLAPAAAKAGNIVLSVQSYLALDQLLDETRRGANLLQLWGALSRAAPDAVKAGLAQPYGERVHAWLQLALIATPEKIDPAALENKLADWRQRNSWAALPDTVAEKIRKRWRYLDFRPERIALLLPLTGDFHNFGRAVEAGFMNEVNADSPAFEIRVYNTDQDKGIGAVYKQAVADGADLVIGPLLTQHVAQLINGRILSVPTISLNYYHDGGPIPIRDYIQFGLLPEDEARQVARRMWDDGHHYAMLLAPDDDWGERIAVAFSEEYLGLGGKIRNTLRYNPTFVDYSNDLRNILDLDAGIERSKLVQDAVGRKLKFTPHIRRDIRAIALFADAGHSTLLYPQLKYHYAETLPVYASSHIYDPQRKVLRELDGIMYCDAPSVIHDRKKDRKFARLYALGRDAYRLIAPFRLIQLVDFSLRGRTGDLSLKSDARIFRKLEWARFTNSRPVPLNHAN